MSKIKMLSVNYSRSKLTAHDVFLIKALLDEGLKTSDIAEKFEVNRSTINRIRSGDSWSVLDNQR